MIHFECPKCAESYQIDDAFSERKGQCERCGVKLIIPRAGNDSLQTAALWSDPDSASPERLSGSGSTSNMESNQKGQTIESGKSDRQGAKGQPLLFTLLITCVVLIGGAAIWFASASPDSKADKIEAPAPTPLVRYQKSNPSTPLEKYGRLSVKGSTIVDESGNIVVLRGMSMFHCPDANRFKNANCVQWLRDDWKCEVIRYPMPTKESKRSYAQDPEGMMKDLATFVDACIDLGMYVIVDYHGGVDPLSHTEEATQLFDAISRKYGECPNLIYETFNEPHAKPKQKLSWTSEVKPFHEAVLQVIRKNAPDNLVLLGTPCFSLNIDEVLESPVTKFKNVVYVAHFYAATHKNGNREKVKKVIEAGFPVYISEFGTCTYTGDGKLDTESFSAWMDLLDQYHVGWCNWSVHDKNETASILKPKSSSLGGWEESQLTPSGKLIRQRLLDASQTHK